MLQKLNNLRKIIFGTTPENADNAVARLADINNIVEQLNNSTSYVSRMVTITQVPGVAPVISQPINASLQGGVVVTRPCSCLCNYPPSPNNNLAATFNGKCRVFCCLSFNYVAPGVIGLTIPNAASFKVGIFAQNMINLGETVNIERLPNVGADAFFTINVVDATGVASDTVLKDAMFNIVMFTGTTV